MLSAQNCFFLLKSDPKASSLDVARSIRKLPGAKEVWMTEREYSFIARFCSPAEDLSRLKPRLERHKGIVGVTCVPAPFAVKC